MSLDLDAVRFGVLGEFIVACAFIVALCRVMLTRIAGISKKSLISALWADGVHSVEVRK